MASRKKKGEDVAPAQQKATPVEPPEGGAKQIASPMSFFNDPRMDPSKSGVRNFAPQPQRSEPGNAVSPDPEGDD